jgi:glycosyltransferase involved in cell wall biosynthesis
MRILLADPSSFTPEYDHELASALVRAGADVELAASRFRFGHAPTPVGYRRNELFYPLSSRLFRRSRLRLPMKALEHPLGLARLTRRPADVLHVQWLAAPQLDAHLLRSRAPLVFTAHDLLPRRTAAKVDLWRRLLSRFERVVVHSEHGRDTLAGLGVPAERLRVIPHPVFPSDPPRRDDGRTVLALGMIRPYKGLGDAVEAVTKADGARLLVAGEPLEPVDRYRAAAGDRGSGTSARRRSTTRSARRPSQCFPTARRSTRAARCYERSVPAFPPSPTTSPGSLSRSGASGPAVWSPRETSTRLPPRSRSSPATPTHSQPLARVRAAPATS